MIIYLQQGYKQRIAKIKLKTAKVRLTLCEREVQTAFINNMYAINVRKTQHEGEMQKSVWDLLPDRWQARSPVTGIYSSLKSFMSKKPNSAFCVCVLRTLLMPSLFSSLPRVGPIPGTAVTGFPAMGSLTKVRCFWVLLDILRRNRKKRKRKERERTLMWHTGSLI